MWRKLLQEFSNNGHVRPEFHGLIRYADKVEQVLPLLKRET
jgi:hypothetical protein